MTPPIRSRTAALAAALLAGLAAFAVAVPAPAHAAPVTIAAGELQWGVKASFRSYIEGNIAHGQVVTDGGATRAGDVFVFPSGGGTFDGTTAVDAAFGGSVHFTGHSGALDLTFSDLRVVVSGAGGTLYADAAYAEGAIGSGSPVVPHDDVPVAALNLTGVIPTPAGASGSRWSGVPATLTTEGATAFAGFYQPGDALDPVSFTVSSADVPRFTSLAPARLLDTRVGGSTIDGQAQGIGVRSAGTKLTLRVTGRADVPTGAAAVALNVTVASAQAPGYVTVWPCDAAQPNASSLNYESGQTVANAVITKVAGDGTVCLYVAEGSTDLIADVTGYFPAGSAYTSLTPARLLDTRDGGATVDGTQPAKGAVAAGKTVELPVAGRGGVAAGAASVVLNVTVTAPEGTGYVTVYPCGTRPNASSLNFVAGQNVPNAVVTKLSSAGTVCLYVAEAATQLIADVTGYFPAGSDYTSLTPARLADTRSGGATVDGKVAGGGARIGGGSALQLLVVGRGGVPANATSVVLNVTADGARGTGYVTVYPCDVPRPNASSLNFVAGRTTPNAVISQISVGGTVCLYVAEATTDLIVDVVGAFTA